MIARSRLLLRPVLLPEVAFDDGSPPWSTDWTHFCVRLVNSRRLSREALSEGSATGSFGLTRTLAMIISSAISLAFSKPFTGPDKLRPRLLPHCARPLMLAETPVASKIVSFSFAVSVPSV